MRRRYTFLSLFLVALAASLMSCGGAKDVYHVGTHGWIADSIYFHVYATADSSARVSLPRMSIDCRSCNAINAPQDVQFDSTNTTRVYIPEAVHDLSARLHVSGKGIDTTFIQKMRDPKDAASYYHLKRPLVGRVLVMQFALLYTDSTQDSVAANTQLGDELNIFGERKMFYEVHHPLFEQPLLLLKSNAVRLY